ncbi:thioredoxin domain-containing protein [Hymenobacter sp. DH14]|uniref:Thioredoxin domain-containing protein n=1 Tax=Hymenobacter cyanobacteriorum TaxID=2926463 RepID=A0A9X1VJ46_9BACT|nr:vitamin K epoxide reductase family protein [Hymenobacter cyanobacteriorum]MCI1187940.1 thioredoxin domain-containing protein [Hymenobacter cyanobacteriorum]
MEQAVARFLQLLRLPVARHECQQLIQSHPDYPALVSVSDALDSLGVNNYVAQFDEAEVDEVAFPYLAHLSDAQGNGDLVLITNAAELAAARANPTTWSGILVQADGLRVPPSPEQAQEVARERKQSVGRKLAWGLGAGLLLQPFFYLHGWVLAAAYGTALVGVVVGWVLLAKDLGITSEIVDDFCGGGSHAGCDEVLQADPVRLFNFFTLSEAAAAYFSWQVGLLLVAALAPATAAGLGLLAGAGALLGLPVVAFSLYYQQAVAKAWCRLCLVVDAVLLVQAGLAIYVLVGGGFVWSAFGLGSSLTAVLALLAISVLVVALKQFGLRYNEVHERELRLLRSKNSVSLFTAALLQQPRADLREFNQELVLGNPDAPIEILMVSNPFCAPCKRQHEQLDHLLALHPEKLKVRLRFVVSAADTGRFPTATQYLLHYWLTNIWGTPDEPARTATLLHDWYTVMNLDKFAATHPADFTDDYSLSTQLGTQHYVWVKQHGIARTPTLYLNGYQFPNAYKVADLQLMLPGLAEHFSQELVLAD